MKKSKILACMLATSIAIGSYGAINSAYAADTDNTQVIMSSDQDRPAGPPPDGKPPMGPPPTGSAHHGAPPNGMPGGFGGHGSMSEVKYSASTEINSASSQNDKAYASDTAEKSALIISTADNVNITNPTITKAGDSDGRDNCNFYGQNATVLVKGGSTTTIIGGTITSDASGANGVFSYGGNGGQNGAEGDGTKVIIRDTKITTSGSGSGGIMTTGGGITEAYNLDITTNGQSSAPIRSDRGGGKVIVDGGTYVSHGLGSPTIYSTADITVSNATLESTMSEGVCIEGLNSITLNNCDMTANNRGCNANATFNDMIMIYQSFSGDADSGTSFFNVNGGSLTNKNGHVFHVTNTNAVINLDGVKIVNQDANNVLMSVCDDGWNGGSNVATVNAAHQVMEGNILVGENSKLILNIKDNSTFTGSICGNITNVKGETVSTNVGNVSVSLDNTSKWILMDDTHISSFTGNISQITANGHSLYVDGVKVL
ncbi:proline-rich domain-containing protein [Anaerovibrio lipolyticus]|uniref:proline-rich domain-containing protein n=1 Tax=Anaerovibrio lipolyticus TaxID=82374 RepID=UPI0004883479|nr:proline-rich domain-containing protein [Anaerovibrio lipolyticus]